MIPSARTTDCPIWARNEIENSDWSLPIDREIIQEQSFIKLYHQNLDENPQPIDSWTNDSESFYRSIEPVIRISNFFGLFDLVPEINSKPTTNNVKLLKRIYNFIVLIILVMVFTRSLEHLVKTTTGMNNCIFSPQAGVFVATSITIFYVAIFLEFLLFSCLPLKWTNLQKEWKAVEKKINSFNQSRLKFRKKFMTIFCISMIFGVVEYVWWIIYAFDIDYHYCDAWWEDKNNFNVFKTRNYTFTSIVFTFRDIILAISTIFTTFIWNFTDLFIILVSTGLAEQYKFMNESTLNTKMWKNHDNYWHQLRVNYSGLSKLVKETDEILSPLIFLSCTHNFFNICLFLFIGISLDNDVSFSEIYPIFAFFFVLVRALVVMFSASRIHDQSKIILPIIYECPKSKFTIETQRLEKLLSGDDVALTGMNFFAIKRNFILAVAGTVVTYEIILIKNSINVL